jgi:hypothetical protein
MHRRQLEVPKVILFALHPPAPGPRSTQIRRVPCRYFLPIFSGMLCRNAKTREAMSGDALMQHRPRQLR